MLKEFGTIFLHHWYIMFPIAACSAAGVAIVVERFLVLNSASAVDKDELLNFIQSYCIQGQVQKAISAVSQSKGPLSNIVRAGLVSVAKGSSPEEVQTAMDAVALREIPRISRRIDLLSAIANVAVLLGLLGTVTGMIAAFGAVANLPPADKAKVLASSIAEALIATEGKSGGSQIHNHGQDEQQKHQHREAESSHRDAIGRGGFWQRRRGQVHHEQNTGTNRSRAQKRIQRGSYRAELTTKGII
jgi:biopolymer transport protein ExbB/TolQ